MLFRSHSLKYKPNLCGNIFKLTDGINIYGYSQHLVYISNYGFADNIGTTPYTDVGFTLAKANGYISAFGYSNNCDFMFLPSETLGTNSTPVGDNTIQNNTDTNWHVLSYGGVWVDSLQCGIFETDVRFSSGIKNKYNGARLVYIPQ